MTSPKQPPSVSFAKAVLNMSKAAIGLGTILLITSMQTLGLGYGIIALLLSAFLSALTLHFLGRVTSATRSGTYFGLSAVILGRKGEIVAMLALGIVLFGSLMGYAYYIGQYASCGLAHLSGRTFHPKIVSGIILYLIVLPVSCLKDLSKLGVVSIFGMLIMLAVTVLTIYNHLSSNILDLVRSLPNQELINPEYFAKYQGQPAVFPPLTFASIGCFGSIAFAYTNHFALVGTVNSLAHPTPTRLAFLIILSTIFTATLNILIGLFSLFFFKNTQVSDILSRPLMNTAFAWAKLGVALALSFTFPLLLSPLRGLLDCLMIRIIPKLPTVRHYLNTLLIVSMPYAIVLIFDNKVTGILDVISSLFRVLLVYILPALMILRLPKSVPGTFLRTWERYMAYVVLVFGAVVCIIGPIFPFLRVIGKAPKNDSLVSVFIK